MEIPIATPLGQFTARYSEKGLAELNFPAGRTLVGSKPGEVRSSRAVSCSSRGNEAHASRKMESPRVGCYKIRRWHRATTAALKKILAGRSPGKLPPLDPDGTEFQQRVWNALRTIPAGQTKSYGEIAQAIGSLKAVRAVGRACGANPIPVLVPCHRVLAANGKIGGFSGGLERKRKLLAREGICLQPQSGERK